MSAEAVKRWEHELMMAGSENRGPVLLEACADYELSIEEKRQLVAEQWTVCEAWGEYLPDALELLAELRPKHGPLTTTAEETPGDTLAFDDYLTASSAVTVYRATGGTEPDGGSWTLDLEIAKRFARVIASPRGAFLGVYSEEPVIWEAYVEADDVLGYFTERDEAEAVLPHGAVMDVRAIMALKAVES